MSQVNLLPREILQGQKTKRLTLMVIVAGAVVLALIVGFFLLQGTRLGSVNDDIAAQQQQNQQIQDQIDGLQRFEDLQVQAQQKESLLNAAYAGEVAMSGLLMDLSRVIPGDEYLTSFSVTLQTTAPTDTTGVTTGTTFVGTMSADGEAIGFNTLSVWLTRLEQVQGWANPWMSNISALDAPPDSYTFSTSVDLTQDAVTQRGAAGVIAGG